MDPQAVIKRYLEQQHMMQLATLGGSNPWICSVYYVIDEDYNLYWASLPSRRHSLEIAGQANVAAAVPVAFTKGQPVAGLQIEGSAEMVEDPMAIKPIAERYAAKFGRDDEWIRNFTARKTEHRLYKLTPTSYVLFDEINFPKTARQEFRNL
jgi:uncharacterized protein YhbP (UPF0306 family)